MNKLKSPVLIMFIALIIFIYKNKQRKKLSKISNGKIKIILVSVGVFQEYILENIKQLQYFNYEIIVITEKHFFHKLNNFKNVLLVDQKTLNSEILNNYNKNCKLDKKFRNGFWFNASRRLFLVCELMKKFNLSRCIHLENDVLLYKDLNNIDFENKLYLTIDSLKRCIPSIIIMKDSKILEKLLMNYNFSKDDMYNLGEFYYKNKDLCMSLPIIKKNVKYNSEDEFNINFDKFNLIFDAAAIGQYLGGVDPRNIKGNTKGFVNETCVVKYNNYEFIWKKKDDIILPLIKIEDKEIEICNLHIHSKNLKDFTIFKKDC